MLHPGLHRMDGTISSCGFRSGDRFVVGQWDRSPVGPTVDVMWARPDGERVLLAPDERTRDLVEAVYRFDSTRLVRVEVDHGPRHLHLRAGPVELLLHAGPPALWLPPRPRWFTRRVEAPIAWPSLGVRTFGTSPTGVREWYQAVSCRFLRTATGRVDDRDLGAMAGLRPDCGFGFSESPARPSMVRVRPVLDVPS